MAKFLKKLAGDLLTLEVNTIVKEDMSAAKMPSSRRVALMQLAELYRGKLDQLDICSLTPKESKKYFKWRFGGEYSFKELCYVSADGVELLNKKLKKITDPVHQAKVKSEIKTVQRIQVQSSQILGMFKIRRKDYIKQIQNNEVGFASDIGVDLIDENHCFKSQESTHGWNNDLNWDHINIHPDLDLAPDQITLIRKATEIGVQPILMQTVIQIDGDVTSYLSTRFLRYPEDKREFLLGMQNESISTATTVWKHLFTTIGNLAGKAFHKIFDDKGKKITK